MVKLSLSVLREFVSEEKGAMTLDYVIMLAALIGLSVAGTAAIQGSTSGVNGTIGTSASNVQLQSAF